LGAPSTPSASRNSHVTAGNQRDKRLAQRTCPTSPGALAIDKQALSQSNRNSQAKTGSKTQTPYSIPISCVMVFLLTHLYEPMVNF
jgi:hypothetical protein